MIFFLNDIESDPPANWKELTFELSYENANPSASITTTRLQFVRTNSKNSNVDVIQEWLDNGLGYFEGIPFRIEDECKGETVVLFDGILDLASSDADFSCDIMNVPIMEKGKIDFLNEAAESFTFHYLYKGLGVGESGKISDSDFTKIKYVVSTVPDGAVVAIIAINVFILAKELATLAKEIGTALADGIGSIASFAALLIYFIAIIVALAVLLKAIAEAIIQFVKIHSSSKAKMLFEKGCEHLGLNFSSTIFDSEPYQDLVIVPRKTEKGLKAQSSFIQSGVPDGTFGQFIRNMMTVFNAKIVIKGDVLHFERWDYFKDYAAYTIPDVAIDSYKTNAGEVNSNFLIEYTRDTAELHTYDNAKEDILQVIIRPKNSINKHNVLLKNADLRTLPYAQAIRKDKENFIEKTLGAIVDAFTNLVITIKNELENGDFEDVDKISTRVGMMLTDKDFIGVEKLLIASSDNKLVTNSQELLSPRTIWDNFHAINSPVPTAENPAGNQWLIYDRNKAGEDITIPFCCEDFLAVKDNNYATTADNELSRIDNIVWSPYQDIATIKYRTNTIYTENLTQTIITP